MANDTAHPANVNDHVLSYNDVTRRVGDLPVASIIALLNRGFTHFLGNEQASKVVGKIEAAIAAERGVALKDLDVDRATIKVWREANASKVAAFHAECEAAALNAIAEGTIGTRVAGAPHDPLGSTMYAIAKSEVAKVYSDLGVKVPRKMDEQFTFTHNGATFTRTLAESIDNRLTKFGDRIRKQAQAEVDRKARELAKATGDADADLVI